MTGGSSAISFGAAGFFCPFLLRLSGPLGAENASNRKFDFWPLNSINTSETFVDEERSFSSDASILV
jgi:hypothetical protein